MAEKRFCRPDFYDLVMVGGFSRDVWMMDERDENGLGLWDFLGVAVGALSSKAYRPTLLYSPQYRPIF